MRRQEGFNPDDINVLSCVDVIYGIVFEAGDSFGGKSQPSSV